LFLYINCRKDSSICFKYHDIFCFSNKLIGIDKNIYNKQNRYAFQKELNVKPYFVSQNVFKEILYSLAHGKIDIKVCDIDFIDDSVKYELEYETLEDLMWTSRNTDLYKYVLHILEQYDTEIKSMKFIYDSMEIELTNEGVLNFSSTDEMLQRLVEDKNINKLLLGRI
jgi:hypothetical protein